jgi:hypothetical protein
MFNLFKKQKNNSVVWPSKLLAMVMTENEKSVPYSFKINLIMEFVRVSLDENDIKIIVKELQGIERYTKQEWEKTYNNFCLNFQYFTYSESVEIGKVISRLLFSLSRIEEDF